MKIVGIIPARAGSKRLPGKNTRCFNGVPLIEVTINQALESGVFADIYITTDLPEYVGRQGVIARPEHLAGDSATSDSVVLHVLDNIPITAEDYFVLLQPTSPLRRKIDFARLEQQLKTSFRVISYAYSKDSSIGRTRNGAFYAQRVKEFRELPTLKPTFCCDGYYMPHWTAKYIDTEEDFLECERLYKQHLGE